MIRRLTEGLALLVGGGLLASALVLATASPAAIEPASARPAFLAFDVALCGIGAWLSAWACSRRIARVIAIALLGLLAFAMLAASFRGFFDAAPSSGFQLAAIAFAVLLVARLGLTARRPRPSAAVPRHTR